MVDFSCNDLAARGVEVTAFDSNLRATFKNKSEQPIAGYAVEWSWESIGGVRGGLISHVWEPQLLIHSLVCAKTLRMIRYRSTILPGSSRRLSPGMVDGDNRDVCLPVREEIHEGGWISIANRTPADVPGDIRTASLTMDGVMFLDGEFIGPNKTRLWDEIQDQSRIRLR